MAVTVDYRYRAKVLRVVDGDTIDVLLDLGFRATRQERIRLVGIDAPELRRGPSEQRQRGREASAALHRMLYGEDVIVETEKGDSFGRWLGRVWYLDNGGQYRDAGKDLVSLGLAKPWEGRRR